MVYLLNMVIFHGYVKKNMYAIYMVTFTINIPQMLAYMVSMGLSPFTS